MCGIADLLDGVCTLIFDDRLYHLLHRYQTGLVGRNPELEAPYVRVIVTVLEDYRSMFVTFSRGQAVEQDEIFSYFRAYGLCYFECHMCKAFSRFEALLAEIMATALCLHNKNYLLDRNMVGNKYLRDNDK